MEADREREPLLGARPSRKASASSRRGSIDASQRWRTVRRNRIALLVGVVALVGALVYLSAGLDTGSFGRRNVLLDLSAGLQKLGTCTGCVVGFLGPLKALAAIGDGGFTNILLDVCVALKIQPEDVCIGALETQGPIIAHSLRSMTIGGSASEAFCTHLLKSCRAEQIRPYTVHLPRPVAPTPPKRWESQGRKPFKIVHLSDLHMDPRYAVGSEQACGRPLCCRSATTGLDGLPTRKPARPFGERGCDSPLVLFESMIDAVNHFAGDAAMAVLTGDIVDHAVWLSTERDTVEAVRQAYSLMEDRFPFPVYGTIGNHDTAPTNSFPRDTTRTLMTSDWVMRLHADVWRPYIGARAARDVIERWSGSYAIKDAKTGVRIININTNYAYSANFWLYDSDRWQPDPNGLLAWLARQLQDAEDAGDRAYVIGHIPASGTTRDYSAYFGQVIERYAHIIPFQMFGHSHRSEFSISYSNWTDRNAATAISVTHVGPGLTPASGNPAFTVYSIDPDTYEMLDATHYWTNATEKAYQDGPVWSEYFSARRDYAHLVRGPPLQPTESLGPAYWHRVTEALERNNTAFLEFHKRMTTGWQTPHARPCLGYCKERWIATLRTGSAAYIGPKAPDPPTEEILTTPAALLEPDVLGSILRIAAQRFATPTNETRMI